MSKNRHYISQNLSVPFRFVWNRKMIPFYPLIINNLSIFHQFELNLQIHSYYTKSPFKMQKVKEIIILLQPFSLFCYLNFTIFKFYWQKFNNIFQKNHNKNHKICYRRERHFVAVWLFASEPFRARIHTALQCKAKSFAFYGRQKKSLCSFGASIGATALNK